MKATRTAIATIATAIITTPAFAAAGARVDHSGILVWAFLGLCSMIVAAQVIPAALMVVGMIRGILTRTEAEAR